MQNRGTALVHCTSHRHLSTSEVSSIQIYKASIPSRLLSTSQRNASCLIFNIIGAHWIQTRTVRIQIRLQILSSLVSKQSPEHSYTRSDSFPLVSNSLVSDRVYIISFRPTTRLFAKRPSIGPLFPVFCFVLF